MVVIVPSIYGGYIKLSALILGYRRITWMQGFVYGLAMVLCSFVIRAASLAVGHPLPMAAGIASGLIANLFIGAWFFSSRGACAEGEPIGFGRAIRLSGLALIMMGITVALLMNIPKMLTQGTMP